METDRLPAEIDLLMFNSAGVKIAVDTVQVDGIMSLEQAEQHGVRSSTLNEILEPGIETSSNPSTIIICRDGGEAYGIKVDWLDAIVTVPVKAIQPIPEPLSYFTGPRMFWGAVLRGDDVVLLIDLYRLKGPKSYKAVPAA
ncbi:MAG: chemotaxis protein CheW [Nitrospirae bacterium]|nr:chemotaxis protein CheW [Nitrospirota bacterium]